MVVFSHEVVLPPLISNAQSGYYTCLSRISPDSCIQMSITITITDSIIATTSMIADDTSTCGSAYAIGSVTLDSFGYYSFPSGPVGWLLFFDSTPVCIAPNPAQQNGYADCECTDNLLDIVDGDCHLFYQQVSPTYAYVRCDATSCTSLCNLMFFPAPYGGESYARRGVLVSGNAVNYDGVNYGP